MLTPGITGRKTVFVDRDNTAEAVGSGGLPVFATPSLVALMEAAAMQSVLPFLDEGQGTVGTQIDVQHLAATPIGMEVVCESELTEVDRRRLTFRITASDGVDTIGTATHVRFIVDNGRFMEKAQAKLRSAR